MKRNFVLVMGALAATAFSAAAQAPGCSSGTTAHENACTAAVDLFNYMAPQLGAVVAGGNTTLGQGGTLGGLGHFVISVRGNVLRGSLPQIDQYDPALPNDNSPRTIPVTDQVLGMPAVDAAIGLFGGLPLPLTKIGGVDLLLNAAYIPEYSGNGVSVKLPAGSLKIGYGARVGILQEGLTTPGLGFSYVRRDLPRVDLAASSGIYRFDVTGLEVNTTSWRVTASKSLVAFGLAAGIGQDTYESSGQVAAAVGTIGTASPMLQQELTRTNYFVDVSFGLLLAKVVAEIGMVQGGDEIPTHNTFTGTQADDPRLYGSVGLRIGF